MDLSIDFQATCLGQINFEKMVVSFLNGALQTPI